MEQKKDPAGVTFSLRIAMLLILCGIMQTLWITMNAPALPLTSKIFAWGFDALLLGGGALLFKYKPRIRGRYVAFMLVPLLLMFAVAEACVRMYFAVIHQHAQQYEFAGKVGWTPTELTRYTNHLEGIGDVSFSTTVFGFREYGHRQTSKKRVFVIGDSYTHGYTVSDGKAYYDVIKRSAEDVELFVYGCGGYGTLQEYMILDKFVDEIKPDLILWQFACNDLINNDWELESASYINNKHIIRPYLIGDQIEYKFPTQDYGWLYNLTQHSMLLQVLDVRLNTLKTMNRGTIEQTILPNDPRMVKSRATTGKLLDMVVKRAGKIPVVAFCVDRQPYADDAFAEICRARKIPYVDEVPWAVEHARNSGTKVDVMPIDFHWNEEGHKIAGQTLAMALAKRGMIKLRQKADEETTGSLGANRP